MDNTESILTSVKKALGIIEEYEFFDADIIMHINSVFSILTQLGVGSPTGFTITDKTALWKDFIPEDSTLFESVKSYMYQKVKLLFDPPSSSVLVSVIEKLISEFEWRLMVAAEEKEVSCDGDEYVDT